MPHASSMDELRRETLRGLVELTGPCVSIFLPTHRAGVETNQDPIRLKNLLRDAEEQLQQKGLRSVEARRLLEPAWELQDNYDFWQHQSDGLALYAAPETFHCYRLPIAFAERVLVGDHFLLRPLLQAVTENGRFYVLALSQNRVRLVRCTRHTADETDLGGAPASLDEAAAPENIEADNSYQIRVSAAAPSHSPGQSSAVFYGRGRIDVDHKERIEEFFRKVDAGICQKVKADPGPLIAAGVDYLLPLYRQASTCPSLAEDGVTGSPDLLSADQLREQVLPIAESLVQRDLERDRDRFVEGQGSQRSSNEWADAVRGAISGRIEALFIADGIEQWGRMDRLSWEVELHDQEQPGDNDLMEMAALHAWLAGARVHMVAAGEVPGSGTIAALFRY